jgi:phytol kinase
MVVMPAAPLTFHMPPPTDLWGALLLAAIFGAVFISAEIAWRRFHVDTETTRKLVHAGGGVAVLVVPHVMTSLWSALALALGFAVILGVASRTKALPSVHAIDRRSVGAFVFPFAVAICVVVSRGRLALFEVPLLALALGDAAAAVVGRTFGTVAVTIMGARRTLEGSAAFALTTGTVAAVFYALAGMPLGTAIALAVVTATALAVVEAVSVGGWDNVSIPVVGLGVVHVALLTAALPPTVRDALVGLELATAIAGTATLVWLAFGASLRRRVMTVTTT